MPDPIRSSPLRLLASSRMQSCSDARGNTWAFGSIDAASPYVSWFCRPLGQERRLHHFAHQIFSQALSKGCSWPLDSFPSLSPEAYNRMSSTVSSMCCSIAHYAWQNEIKDVPLSVLGFPPFEAEE